MREYAKILPSFWDGPTGRRIRQLGLRAQVVAAYVLSNRHANMIGLYRLPLVYIVGDLGQEYEEIAATIGDLMRIGFLSYDGDTEMVWVHEMAFYQIGRIFKPNDNQCVAVRKVFTDLEENALLKGFYVKYKDVFHLQSHPSQGVDAIPDKPLARVEPPPSEGLGHTLPKPESSEQRAVSSEQGTESREQKATSPVVLKSEQPLSSELDGTPGSPPPKPVLVKPQKAEPKPEPVPEAPALVLTPPDAEEFADPAVARKGETAAQKAKRKQVADRYTAVVQRVFAHYLQTFNRRGVLYTLTSKRLAKGKSRLQEALKIARITGTTVDEIYENAEFLMMTAVDELAASDWHNARHPTTAKEGKKFIEWEDHLFPSEEKFQQWLRRAQEISSKPRGRFRHA